MGLSPDSTLALLQHVCLRHVTSVERNEVSAVRDARSKIFRFGLTFQRKTVIKALLFRFWVVDTGWKRCLAILPQYRMVVLFFILQYHCSQLLSFEAFEEFTQLWLDDFHQKSLPADAIQVMCALTTALRQVPSQVPKSQLAQKWKAKVVDLLHNVQGRRNEDGIRQAVTWRFVPDDILVMTARLSKLSSEEAEWLATWRCWVVLSRHGQTAEVNLIESD